MCLSRDGCPVPFDQQPLNEFYALQDSGLFACFGLKYKNYIHSLCIAACILFIVPMPIIFTIFSYSWIKFLAFNFLFTMFFLVLILMRLYLGWSYVIDRLFSATIFYEESGWYDGQVWVKTPEMLIKDRLIGTHCVLPILQRVKITLALLLFIFYPVVYFVSDYGLR